jgi:hypothetical protein
VSNPELTSYLLRYQVTRDNMKTEGQIMLIYCSGIKASNHYKFIPPKQMKNQANYFKFWPGM